MSDTATRPGEVSLTREGELAFVTLSHPGRLNAITVQMWAQLRDTFKALARDATVRCIIVRGADANFAAGADIREFPAQRKDLPSVMHYHMHILAPALHAIADCPLPVIAAIEGACVGGGLEIASQCDLRIASTSARFGVPIIRLGFPMAPEEMRGLLSLAGPAITREILLEGRVFDAPEAMTKGLLTRIVAEHDLHDEVLKAARRIAAGAPMAARLNKKTLQRLTPAPPPLTEAELRELFAYAESRDHQAGVAAFLANESPRFSGD